jgi:arylsulfatase A-like enzyme
MMIRNRWFVLCAFIVALGGATAAKATGRAEHVVVVVWDGMRPDFVSATNTPVLWKLSQEGVFFQNHHAVYPSATNINGTAIATGVYPQRSGLIGNREYRPEIDPKNAIASEDPTAVRKADELTRGKYLAAPTIAELIQQSGRVTVIAGAKDNVLLLDRQRERETEAAKKSANLYRKSAASVAGAGSLGSFPPPATPNEKQDEWATKGLTELLWRNSIPAFSLLWLGDPDLSQHAHAPGSPIALQAIRNSDRALGTVLGVLEKNGVRDKTDVFVVSDHGFSTVEVAVDLRDLLKTAGFHAATEFGDHPAPGDIMIVPNGGTEFFYVEGHDAEVTRKLVEWLQQSDFAGVIFSREKLAGTFPLDAAAIATKDAPDVVMAFRWKEAKNQFGTPGMIAADWQRMAGSGTHATLSRFDMHNTLIIAGPDFRRGTVDDLPTGNVDLAPTILEILGIKAPPMDGRVLAEAMIDRPAAGKSRTETLEASREFPHASWRQHLKISRVGQTIYFDEGNGGLVPK